MITNHIVRPSRLFRVLDFFRSIHTSKTCFATRESPLFLLRRRTGLAYNLCREALNKHENDVEQSEIWLKAQAIHHGYQQATKFRDRSAKEGLIGLAISQNRSIATIVEINCETDFVAKNQLFKDFALRITEHVATLRDGCSEREEDSGIREMKIRLDQLKEVEAQAAPLITRLGENIRIRRAIHIKPVNDVTKVYGQVHAQAGYEQKSGYDIVTGRFGALIALRDLNHNERTGPLDHYGARLCRHVIGFNPTYITLPDEIRKHLQDDAAKRNINSGETGVTEETEYSENLDDVSDQPQIEWPSLMDQTLIMSDEVTVKEFCDKNQITVVYFNRFECGQI